MPSAVTYQGGRILTQIRPMAVWAEVTWNDGTVSIWKTQSQRCLLDQFFTDIVQSRYVTALSSAFSVVGSTIGAGPFLGTTALGIQPAPNATKGFISDEEIQAALADAVANNLLPWPTPDTCYFIVIPTDAIVLFQGGRSQKDFGGYHNWFQTQDGRTILYAVIAPSMEDDETLTDSTSHEFAEAITDPTGKGWLGPFDEKGRQMEVCDICFPATTGVHGYSVSLFALSSPRPGTYVCGPSPDNVPRGQNTSAALRLDRKFTRTSCFGNIIEGGSALFHAEAFYRFAPTDVALFRWMINNVQPPGAQVVVPGSSDTADFIVDVFYGGTSFDVEVTLVTTLGCVVQVRRTFDVVTQAAADAQEAACAFMRRLVDLMHIYKWPIPPIPPVPWPLPPWDPQRDFNLHPLTAADLNGMVTLGENLITFANAARPLIARSAGPGLEINLATTEKVAKRSVRLPSAHRPAQ